ncbi:MAG: hypothetical protein SOU27_03950 [Sodaliphilus sp.]|nr:hypothetical protein [Sodaliphilus sp.]
MKKTIISSLAVLLILVSMAAIFYACENQSEPIASNDIDYLQLSPKADLSHIASFCKEDVAIMEKAFIRLGLDKYSPEEAFKTSKNVNMSEDIYNFYYNLYFKNKGIKANRVRRKTNGERADSSKNVQYVVCDILNSLGVKTSVEKITDWCSGNGYYAPGQGIPAYFLQDIFEHYFYNSSSLSGLNNGDYQSGSTVYTVVVKDSNSPYGQICRVQKVFGYGDNAVYICADPMKNEAEKRFYTSEITCVWGVANPR